MSAGGWQDALPLGPLGPAGRAAPLPRWAGDARLARLAWSRLAEPEDELAARFVAARGPREAVERLASSAPVSAAECTDGEHPAALRAGMERWRSRWDQTDPERDLARLAALGGRVVLPEDEEWPQGLQLLGDAQPFALWVRGPLHLARTASRSVALVGSRAATDYGLRIAAELAAGAGDHGVATVSGAALGIDGAAHRGALAAGAPTVAVLACGVDRAYPPAHERLLAVIAQEGAVVSEAPPGSSPMRRRFLQRNRIIAAVAGATVVVEAGWRSGAQSTALRAALLGRPLGAVPGPVTSPASAGCHRLMREAEATCITDAGELVELVSGMDWSPPVRTAPARPHDGLSQASAAVLDALPVRSPRPPARLAATAGLPEPLVATALLDLARRGLAAQEAGGWRRAGLEPGGAGH